MSIRFRAFLLIPFFADEAFFPAAFFGVFFFRPGTEGFLTEAAFFLTVSKGLFDFFATYECTNKDLSGYIQFY